MASERAENQWIVATTCLLAILGVILLRTTLGLNYQVWFMAYLAMGLTASIRRTSAGNTFSVWSALRGIGCLVIGLYLTRRLGYHGISYCSAALVPNELIDAFDRVRYR